MKKIVLLLFFTVFLHACSEMKASIPEKEQVVEDKITFENEVVEKTNQDIPSMLLNNNDFHSVIGWMSNEEIAFIFVEKGQWLVKTYTVPTNTWKTIYTTTTPIIQGTIHPLKEMILLHTSKDSSSAEIQFLHKNGFVTQSLSFESSEIYMDWHPTNPNLVVFSTFYEDWTYSTFVYDGETQALSSIDIENPFVKWYDEDHLSVYRWAESGLDGSELFLYSIKDKTLKATGEDKVLDVTNIGEAIVYVQINEEEKQLEYRLESLNGSNKLEWTAPAVSNYSEWVIPTMSIVSSDEFMLLNATESRNQDDTSQKSILSKISLDGQVILGEVGEQPISCSPNGETCLGGYSKENWINTNPLKVEKWIYFNK
ncbi:hypothetical protein [Psychrobacillus sp. OK028]|uniref:YqgU-like beta propeller domain-containing protein n=1 Tax=Psychrobacillus sp. OK028 TaxID=1884359 RepID=UPI000B88B883|nr:hypothetical protein [Psychrobacillus sp. OK028]